MTGKEPCITTHDQGDNGAGQDTATKLGLASSNLL